MRLVKFHDLKIQQRISITHENSITEGSSTA